MAHNIYLDPDLSSTSGKFSDFSIDFEADDTPEGTYWALCNWAMDTSSLETEYTIIDNGGAYAGLQNTENGEMAIMSFWEVQYQDEQGTSYVLNAERLYPEGNENYFGGEGEGTNYITAYEWEAGKWYRMQLHCYEDGESGHTIVEQWIADLQDGSWTLISRFDTGLTDSCFVGGMSQFMENYDSATSDEVRSFKIRNLFVKERGSDTWTPIQSGTLSIDTWYGNKSGSYSFGAEEDYFWGTTCGAGEDQANVAGHEPTAGEYEISKLLDNPGEPGDVVTLGDFDVDNLVSGTIFTMRNAENGLYLQRNGTGLSMTEQQNSDSEWLVDYDKNYGFNFIRSVSDTQYVLDIDNAWMYSGNIVKAWEITGYLVQSWHFEDAGQNGSLLVVSDDTDEDGQQYCLRYDPELDAVTICSLAELDAYCYWFVEVVA
jgi:hypothetical protein